MLLHVWDPLSNIKFLVDARAEIKILLANASHKSLPPIMNLYVANGSTIPVYTLNFKLQCTFQWTFYVAAVSQAILGADFMRNLNLLVDIKNRRLLDTTSTKSTWQYLQISTIDANNPFPSLLKSFPSLTQPYSATLPIKHSVTYHIETTGPPTPTNEEFKSLLRLGIIYASSNN